MTAMPGRLFVAGQRVICVDANFMFARRRYPGCNWPRQGHLYFVRGYVCDGKWPAIVVREITNPAVLYSDGVYREAGFSQTRFAPAIDMKEFLRDMVGDGPPVVADDSEEYRTVLPKWEKEDA